MSTAVNDALLSLLTEVYGFKIPPEADTEPMPDPGNDPMPATAGEDPGLLARVIVPWGSHDITVALYCEADLCTMRVNMTLPPTHHQVIVNGELWVRQDDAES